MLRLSPLSCDLTNLLVARRFVGRQGMVSKGKDKGSELRACGRDQRRAPKVPGSAGSHMTLAPLYRAPWSPRAFKTNGLGPWGLLKQDVQGPRAI